MDFPRISAWAIDFMRACYERNVFMRLLFRIALGKYAYREFIGLRDAIAKEVPLDSGYELQQMDYHSDKTSLDFKEMP